MGPKRFTVRIPLTREVYETLKKATNSQGEEQKNPRLCVSGRLPLVVKDYSSEDFEEED